MSVKSETFYPNDKLKQARVALNLTQEQLAYQLGYSRSTIALIESGRRTFTPNLSKKFFDLFQVRVPPSYT